MLGLNWVPQEEQIFHLISYQQIGILVILLVCVGEDADSNISVFLNKIDLIE